MGDRVEDGPVDRLGDMEGCLVGQVVCMERVR